MPDYGLLNYGLRSIGDSVRSGQKFLLQSRRLDQTDRSLKIAEDQNRRQAEAYAQKKRLNRMRDSSNKINVSRLQAQKEGLNYSDYLKKNPAMLNTVVRGVMENAPGLKGILPEGVKASFVLDNDQKIRAYDESGKLISNSDGSSLEVSFDEFEAETMSQSIQAGAYFALSAQRDLERDYKTGAISATQYKQGQQRVAIQKNTVTESAKQFGVPVEELQMRTRRGKAAEEADVSKALGSAEGLKALEQESNADLAENDSSEFKQMLADLQNELSETFTFEDADEKTGFFDKTKAYLENGAKVIAAPSLALGTIGRTVADKLTPEGRSYSEHLSDAQKELAEVPEGATEATKLGVQTRNLATQAYNNTAAHVGAVEGMIAERVRNGVDIAYDTVSDFAEALLSAPESEQEAVFSQAEQANVDRELLEAAIEDKLQAPERQGTLDRVSADTKQSLRQIRPSTSQRTSEYSVSRRRPVRLNPNQNELAAREYMLQSQINGTAVNPAIAQNLSYDGTISGKTKLDRNYALETAKYQQRVREHLSSERKAVRDMSKERRTAYENFREDHLKGRFTDDQAKRMGFASSDDLEAATMAAVAFHAPALRALGYPFSNGQLDYTKLTDAQSALLGEELVATARTGVRSHKPGGIMSYFLDAEKQDSYLKLNTRFMAAAVKDPSVLKAAIDELSPRDKKMLKGKSDAEIRAYIENKVREETERQRQSSFRDRQKLSSISR